MKKLISISVLTLLFFNNIEAQEIATGKSKNSFIELNFGVALIDNEFIGIFPGNSFLWGKTYVNDHNFIFEYQYGFALPGLITGKLGIGKKFEHTNVIVGVRPHPFNLFLQSSFSKGKNGYWIASIEVNPLDYQNSLSMESKAILNFGYRWNRSKKKN